jgi:putative DNA methylase
MTYRKKLIEVALPLDVINQVSAREKTIRHGHPSTLHLWWARRPLAACRAVLFASLVDDPSEHPELFPTKEAQEKERDRLFSLIEQLVQWENSNNEDVLQKVRAEILKSTGGNPPPVLDPFAGGGSIPLEAQRLGLEAHASDLNPVAVLINKALIEIPPKFSGCPPVNPEAQLLLMGSGWHGARGLADDIRYYGKWMRDEAKKRIGHLYPKVTLSKEYGGGEATVIAWLWTRTVVCPNPACGARMPLVRTFYLSKKKGKEAWVDPHVDYGTTPPTIRYVVTTGKGKAQDGTVNRLGARCIVCCTPVPFDYVRSEGKAGRMEAQLMAIVAEGQHGRAYLSPNDEQVAIAEQAKPEWKPEANLPHNPRDFKTPNYGMRTFSELFTPRQLVALTTFSDLVQEARGKVLADAQQSGMPSDGISLNDGGTGANVYADAVTTYIALALDKMTTTNTSICTWQTDPTRLVAAFGRQSIPMAWDYAEANPFSGAAGDYGLAVGSLTEVLDRLVPASVGIVHQADAASIKFTNNYLVSTDPPYYDNIGYADLSDFFYVWLRRSLIQIYPDLFNTLLVPKAQELIATPYRFEGNKSKAKEFFEIGLVKVFERMRTVQHPSYPLTVYYAFKQAESESEDEGAADIAESSNGNGSKAIASTGWETMLEGLIRSGFTITGTWPMRTELVTNLKKNMSSLASSIVLVCRPRLVEAQVASRRQFLNALRAELPAALKNLQRGSVAPVDLAQASIGPGMAIYSRYSKVVESDGTPLRVRTALQLINRALDEALAEQEGEYDTETRWAVAWFEEYAMNAGEYGRAETLSKAKNTAVQALEHAGLVVSRAGKVRLVKREELSSNWNPKTSRLTVWEIMQRMIFALLSGNGEIGAGDILRSASSQGEVARDLAYRLFVVCERKGWTQEALAYNSLVTSWLEISRLAHREADSMQQTMFLE